MKAKNVFDRIERFAVGEADDESKRLTAPQDGRLWLSMHQFVTDSPMLVGVILGVKVDFVYDQDGLIRFRSCLNCLSNPIEKVILIKTLLFVIRYFTTEN